MPELSDAEKLYQAAKEVLAVCPDCGYEWAGCVCYEGSDAWLEDMRRDSVETDSRDYLLMLRGLYGAIAEDWDDPSMDIYDDPPAPSQDASIDG